MADSSEFTVDRIPGVLREYRPLVRPAPLIVDSPHSGREYPAEFSYSVDILSLRSAEDAYVDELCIDVPIVGGHLLVADFPRSYIDVNRDTDDLNPALLDGVWRTPLAPSKKTIKGIGLVRAKLANGADIYDERLAIEDVESRIRKFYHPYHDRLEKLIGSSIKAHGIVWHISMHSMASTTNAVTPERAGKTREIDIVLGDLDGKSCDQSLTTYVKDYLSDMGYRVSINNPYKGAAIVRRYGNPTSHRHTLQIEVNRALYLNEARVEKHEGFDRLQQNLSRLFHALVVDFVIRH